MGSQTCGLRLKRLKTKLFNSIHLIFFFTLTFYFGDTHRLMYKKLNMFAYVFVVSCLFFQINPAEYPFES